MTDIVNVAEIKGKGLCLSAWKETSYMGITWSACSTLGQKYLDQLFPFVLLHAPLYTVSVDSVIS